MANSNECRSNLLVPGTRSTARVFYFFCLSKFALQVKIPWVILIFGGWKEVAVHCLDGRGMTQMERGQKMYPLFLYFPKSINDPVSSRIHSPLKAR